MRTTITLDDALIREAKLAAAKSGKSLNKLVEDAIRDTLARQKMVKPRQYIELPVFKGGRGARPGVDITDSAALLDLMDRADADS
jgi:hypothetical protein